MTDYNIDFKDHKVQHPNRFRQVQVSPGVVDLVPTWIENPSEVIEEGTPVNAELFDKLRAKLADMTTSIIGVSQSFATAIYQHDIELDRYKKQKLLQGKATIINTITDDGYFRSAEPFVLINLSGWPQSNAPDYDVVITPAGDASAAGAFIVYDKTQNGFKVKMTGSAKSAAFTWTLINPNIQ